MTIFRQFLHVNPQDIRPSAKWVALSAARDDLLFLLDDEGQLWVAYVEGSPPSATKVFCAGGPPQPETPPPAPEET